MQELNGQRWGRSPRLGLNTFCKKHFLVTMAPHLYSQISGLLDLLNPLYGYHLHKSSSSWCIPSFSFAPPATPPHTISWGSTLQTSMLGKQSVYSRFGWLRNALYCSGDGVWQKPQPLALPGLHKTAIMAIKDGPREQGMKLYTEDKSPETQGPSLL